MIRTEYIKNRIKKLIYLIPIVIITISFFTLVYPLYLLPDNDVGIATMQPSNFCFTITWTFISISTYLVSLLIKLAFMRITPSLKEYIKNEVNSLGYKIYEKRKSWISFLILNFISVLTLFLIEFKVIFFYNTLLTIIFISILSGYLFLGILIPIFWCFFYDGLRVKLKGNYQVIITPYYKIRKSKVKDYHLICIYLTSNPLAYKFKKVKKLLYIKIARTRWLPRKRKSVVSKYNLSPFLRFNEFSTPTNFQKQFLNITLALQEWDNENRIKL